MDLIWQGKRVLVPGGALHLSVVIPTPPSDPTLKMEITTTSSNQTVTIPHQAGYNYNYTIDYGDGSAIGTVTAYNSPGRSHIYATAGVYIMKIVGICENIYIDSGSTFSQFLTKILQWGNTGLKVFYGSYCNHLIQMDTDSIGGLASLVSFSINSTTLTGIPSGLFNYATGITNFSSVFAGCSLITAIPSGLFNNCPNVTSFYNSFGGCSSLTAIPSGLFNNNTNVNTFENTFTNCTGITSVPAGLFDYNTGVTTFYYTFNRCYVLETVPNNLFRNNIVATDFGNTFYYNYKLQINPWTFYTSGEESTRFSGKTLSFVNCFNRPSFTGNQGTAPALWDCTFGSVATTSCFSGVGNSLTSLDNYNSIPIAWGGPA